jgi:sialate O-acetylesterase
MQGAMWFRRTVDIPAEWAGKEVKLNLGSILNYDIAWFNGVEVGRSNKELFKEKKASGRREYTIPAELVKPGPAVLAVRVFSATGDGGILGYPEWEKRNIELALAEDKKSVVLLKGPWKYAVGHELPHRGVVVDPGSHKLPSSCFNGMVSPVLPYRVKGILWYQGESSTHNAWEYRALFQLLIRSWRQAWAEELPFIYVQLPGVGGESKNPTDDSQYNESWNELRDAQWFGLREPNTAMVAAIDLGEAGIHPSNKQDVGARLAVASRGLVDKEKIEYLGPLYAGIKVEGNKIRVKFTHIGDGLVAKDGAELKRFAIAGADRKYVWAKAVIEGDSVVVSADEVPAPVAVSYAWAMNPVGANLYNSAGLPAAPFRSDDWPMRTHGRKSPY